ncbi:hypothetical protein BJY00DRAFT_284125 [Aspergillus carlsbadensis]|nr:hypothetical protein BJY00DRAFT_284125 [Aspergillus carlsbadensis]
MFGVRFQLKRLRVNNVCNSLSGLIALCLRSSVRGESRRRYLWARKRHVCFVWRKRPHLSVSRFSTQMRGVADIACLGMSSY